jgi:hypothetical protein
MAGIYTLLGVVMLGVIARTLLREGRPVGWNAILLTLFIGGSFDLVVGGLWFQHGSPLYQLFGVAPIQGFGWTGLYGYMAAWSAALMLSYGPVFRKAPTSRTTAESGSVQ